MWPSTLRSGQSLPGKPFVQAMAFFFSWLLFGRPTCFRCSWTQQLCAAVGWETRSRSLSSTSEAFRSRRTFSTFLAGMIAAALGGYGKEQQVNWFVCDRNSSRLLNWCLWIVSRRGWTTFTSWFMMVSANSIVVTWVPPTISSLASASSTLTTAATYMEPQVRLLDPTAPQLLDSMFRVCCHVEQVSTLSRKSTQSSLAGHNWIRSLSWLL